MTTGQGSHLCVATATMVVNGDNWLSCMTTGACGLRGEVRELRLGTRAGLYDQPPSSDL